ncbi:uncharacterized protein LOC113317557 [Papaver somniferum]|uniref:uncharacterized protein LOC113317557 n=1 Tax=Papaver somniferum TaxID=3469 RepID=UPI000E7042D8|nr:uncharacterized protein LOC113317557 [Papaver somniferum]
MIIEAIARVSNPVHGLAGIAETLSQQLEDLTSELTAVNQQNKHNLHRIIILQQKLVEEPQNRPISPNGASSSARVVLPPLTLQDLDNYYNWLSPVVVEPTTASSSYYTNQMRDIKAKLKSDMDAKESTVDPNLCSGGAILKCSNNYDDAKPTSIAASSSFYTNQLRYIQEALMYDKVAKESTVNPNLYSSGAILKCSNHSDDVKPTSTAASSSFYTNQLRYIPEALKSDMDAKESTTNPNLCSSGVFIKSSENVDDLKPTAASLSVHTYQLGDNQAELKDHMDAKELSLNLTLCSSGTISKCSHNDGDFTKECIQDNKDITGKGTPPIKEEPRFI